MQSSRGATARLVKLYSGIAIIIVVGFGSIFAASITLNSAHSTAEFGQGVYKIKACDSYVRLNLNSGTTGAQGAPAGLSALTGISITSLDPKACKGTTFTINAYDLTASQTPLFRIDGHPLLCSDDRCTAGSNSQNDITINIDSHAQVALASPDDFHSLNFDSKTAIYTVAFSQPTILASEIGRLTIQSGNMAS
jgi:hypothetical protein